MSDSARWFFTCKVCSHRYAWTGPQMPIQACPKCEQRKAAAAVQPAAAATQSAARTGVTIPLAADAKRIKEALELCDEINETANEVPDAGSDFAESVREQAEGIRETILRLNRVSDAQFSALDNFLGGLRAWIRD